MTFNRQKLIAWGAMLLALTLAWLLRGVLAYFLVAVIFSFIGSPLMRFLDRHFYIRKHKVPRGISAFLVILSFVLVFGGFFYVILPPLLDQLSNIRSISSDQLNASFSKPLQDFRVWCESMGIETEKFTVEYFKNQIRGMFNIDNVSKFAGNLVAGTSSVIGWIFITTFITFFLLKEKYLFYRILHSLTPTKHEPAMQRIMRNLNAMLGRYFRSLLLQIVVFGTYIFIGLKIAGEEYALTVAIFSGLMNLISYIGPLMGVSFALLFSILSHIGADFYGVIVPEMFQVMLVYMIAVMLDNFFSYPMIFSNSLKVHPLELFFVILSGAQLGGLPGMMVAAPTYTVLRILAKELFSQFSLVQNITRKI